MARELERLGIDPRDIGSHSLRKGSATFVASGSTSCPPMAAITIRVGWRMGGVQDTYIRYESAGDQFVGRTVSGLPINDYRFALLPPFIEDSEILDEIVNLCFPDRHPDICLRILDYAAASLVYHSEYLLETLPPNHPLLATALFSDLDRLAYYRTFTKCVVGEDHLAIKVTGLPPHVETRRDLQKIKEMVQEFAPFVKAEIRQGVIDTVNGSVEGITHDLEERAIGARTVTTDGLDMHIRATLRSTLEEVGLVDLARNSTQQQVQTPETNSEPLVDENNDSANGRARVYFWGDGVHLLPEDFEFPKGTALVLWQWWMYGNPTHGYPPLRQVSTKDFVNKDKRRRYADASLIMKKLEDEARQKNVWNPRPSLVEANQIYEQCKTAIEVPSRTQKNRQRRKNQLAWRSVVKLLREGNR